MDFIKSDNHYRWRQHPSVARDDVVDTPEQLCDHDIMYWRNQEVRYNDGRQQELEDAGMETIDPIRRNDVNSCNRRGELIDLSLARHNIFRIY